jgi:hypothetical protein
MISFTDDIVRIIVSYLDGWDLYATGEVDRQWRRLSDRARPKLISDEEAIPRLALFMQQQGNILELNVNRQDRGHVEIIQDCQAFHRAIDWGLRQEKARKLAIQKIFREWILRRRREGNESVFTTYFCYVHDI